MANPIQWVRYRWQRLMTSESRNGDKQHSPPRQFWWFGRSNINSSRSAAHRVVIPCLNHFRDEYDRLKKAYMSNRIRTTKYTLLNFIPRNIFEQFHRAANIYFLFLIVLNWVPLVEAFQKEITMLPLLVVLTIIAIKDGLEDYRKYKLDKVINNLLTRVYCRVKKKFVESCWKDVHVGNFIKLRCDEIVPADMVLIHSSDPDGICHIETSSLDGETNLKQRQVVKGYAVDCEFDPETFSSRIQCESPNSDIGRFKGFLDRPDMEKVGLSKENLLLRGCIVRNTEAAVGIVVYAGHETKTMLNNSGPRYKRSRLERHLNTDVLWCVLLLLVMCLTGAIGHGLWLSSFTESPVYNIPEPNGQHTHPALAGFYMFWTMIILLQVLIPISLYVSIEIVKLGQVYFIQNDLDFYCDKTDSMIECRALNIAEDLGQVQYIFSDKTGTLTENKMVFRRCSIAGVEYSHDANAKRLKSYQQSDLEGEKMHKPYGAKTLSNKLSSSSLNLGADCDPVNVPQHPRHVAFSSPMEKDVIPDTCLLKKFTQITPQSLYLPDKSEESALETSYIVDFFLALAICNTVVVSLPNQPCQKVRMPSIIRSPMKSLEEIKLMFQKFSLRKSSSASLTSGKESYSESANNFVSKMPFLSKVKLASPASDVADQSINELKNTGSLDSAMEVDPGYLEKSDISNCDELDNTSVGDICYEAESPDEAALVHAARAYKYTLKSRTPDQLTVELDFLGPLTFQLLHILPFDSVRKRMSVIVRHPILNKVVVYTKGADSVIMDLLALPSSENKTTVLQNISTLTQKHLDEYAKGGFRTLCIAKKVLTDSEYAEWLQSHFLAETSIDKREELLFESALRLETKLTLLGATGIEDRLQEGVPDTIESLKKAGIKIWMLTGDKQETAVNIAYACKLLEHSDKIFILSKQGRESCEILMNSIIENIESCISQNTSEKAKGLLQDHADATEKQFGLVIDGRTLEFALHGSLQNRFLSLTQRCRAVICCRATPLQKSKVVKLVRNSLEVMTLAVGDGANDVSMIQVADIGVGISGQEGMQAVMSSDFAVSHFKHLRKLLLVHGHWCYTRLANMILYFFYKNVMFVNLLFWYQFFCGFSGTALTDFWMLILFNLIFTSVPPIIYGVLDKDVSADTLALLPELYKSGAASEAYQKSTFWITMLDACYQSLACFFIPYFTYFGSDMDIFSFGNFVITASLFVVLLHLLIESKSLAWIHLAVMGVSVVAYFLFTLAFGATCITCNPPANPYWTMQTQASSPAFYLVTLMATVIALLPRYAYRIFQGTISPSPQQRAKQLDAMTASERAHAIKLWKGDTSQICDNTSHCRKLADGSITPNEGEEASQHVNSGHTFPISRSCDCLIMDTPLF